MAEQESKIRLTAVDETAAAINSATARLKRLPADGSRGQRGEVG